MLRLRCAHRLAGLRIPEQAMCRNGTTPGAVQSLMTDCPVHVGYPICTSLRIRRASGRALRRLRFDFGTSPLVPRCRGARPLPMLRRCLAVELRVVSNLRGLRISGLSGARGFGGRFTPTKGSEVRPAAVWIPTQFVVHVQRGLRTVLHVRLVGSTGARGVQRRYLANVRRKFRSSSRSTRYTPPVPAQLPLRPYDVTPATTFVSPMKLGPPESPKQVPPVA